MGTQPFPFPKRGGAPQFSAHICCDQTAAYIKMPLGTEIGLGLCDIMLDGDPAPPTLKGHSPQFSANARCGQTVHRTNIPLGMEVGFGPDDFVFDGDPARHRKKAHPPHPFLGPCLLWSNGWMDQDSTWYGGKPRTGRRCVRWGRSSLTP